MMIDETFYVAISFMLLALVLYLPIKNWFSSYLQNRIDKLSEQISNVESIHGQMRDIFYREQSKFDEFIRIKGLKIAAVKENAAKLRVEYVDYTNSILEQRAKDFSFYLINLKNSHLQNANLKIIQYAAVIVEKVILDENIYISNKLN